MAVASLAVITLIGLFMARGFAGGEFSANRMLWMQVHLTLALLGWVGGLIMAVSWQVIPMFYLSPPVSKDIKRGFLVLLLAGLVLPLLVVFTGLGFDGFFSTDSAGGHRCHTGRRCYLVAAPCPDPAQTVATANANAVMHHCCSGRPALVSAC